jgi:hypothetical protein
MLKNVFVSIKPVHVSVFFLAHLQGFFRCALCRYYPSRKSAGGIVTAQSTAEDPLKMVEKKYRNKYGFYTYKHVFNILLVLNVEVSVF